METHFGGDGIYQRVVVMQHGQKKGHPLLKPACWGPPTRPTPKTWYLSEIPTLYPPSRKMNPLSTNLSLWGDLTFNTWDSAGGIHIHIRVKTAILLTIRTVCLCCKWGPAER